MGLTLLQDMELDRVRLIASFYQSKHGNFLTCIKWRDLQSLTHAANRSKGTTFTSLDKEACQRRMESLKY